jgi:hypothetical protein
LALTNSDVRRAHRHRFHLLFRNAYTYDDTAQPDPDLQHFSIEHEHDRQYILPVLRETQQVNPDIFYFFSRWSPRVQYAFLSGNMLWTGIMAAGDP